MAKASVDLVIALHNTLNNIEKSSDYQWGHMGSCNCGFLAREITRLRKDEIHSRAMQGIGDWTEQLNDYCATSGLAMDDLISQMLSIGLDVDDLKHLERLSSPSVLSGLPEAERNLKHNVKADVIIYYKAWLVQLEEILFKEMSQSAEPKISHSEVIEKEYSL